MPEPWVHPIGGEYSETLAWLTDVLQAGSTGATQHRRLREAPRTVLAFASQASGDAWRRLVLELRRRAAQAWDVPLAYDERALTASASIGATSLAVVVAGARFVAGGRALLTSPDLGAWEAVEIDTVGTSTLTLADPTAQAWPAGTRVVPLRAARLDPMPAVQWFTADDGADLPLSWRLEDLLEETPATPATTYRGYPVFDLPPVWTADPEASPGRLLATLDNDFGPPAQADLAEVSLDRMVHQHVTESEAGAQALRAWLYLLAGRWGAAWVPSWTQDLRLVANVSNGATTIDVAGPLLSGHALPENLRDIRIELHGGTVLHRRINSVAAPSATVDRLTLDSAITTGFALSAVRTISWLRLCTQAADQNTLNYWAPGVIQTELAWQGLAHAL